MSPGYKKVQQKSEWKSTATFSLPKITPPKNKDVSSNNRAISKKKKGGLSSNHFFLFPGQQNDWLRTHG